MRNLKHGHKRANECSPEYLTWLNMKARCNNQKCGHYARYGGRGITVCPLWNDSFETFLSDMGPRPEGMSLERIDNDGNYEPSNCRWATRTEQANNRRSSKFIEHDGKRLTIAGWARESGVPMGTLWHRISVAKWDMSRAIQPDDARR